MSQLNRRDFLTAASVTLAAASSRRAWAIAPSHISPTAPTFIRARRTADPAALARQAVDAAHRAGATYADARVTVQRFQNIQDARMLNDQEHQAIGVRALVNGYWGFQASAVWTDAEATRLGQAAVAQATANNVGRPRTVELGAIPRVDNGQWSMPVEYDPFTITAGERVDFVAAAQDAIEAYTPLIRASSLVDFTRLYTAFASSDGSSYQQTTYRTGGSFGLKYAGEYHLGLRGSMTDYTISPIGKGWEAILRSNLLDAIPKIVEDAAEARVFVSVDVGRYDVVCAPRALTALLDATLGTATELDRALGYEANAGGTSYLDQPLEMLGQLMVGSPLLTVTANRSHPSGLATVKWDDEGVVPDEFTLVRNGRLVDYQTTREQAAWLAPFYQKAGTPIRSHGCAVAMTGMNTVLQFPPNLSIEPSTETKTFDDLVAGIDNGLALLSLNVEMDPQGRSGVATGVMRKITKGKLGPYVHGGTIMFTSTELWTNLSALGGQASCEWWGMSREKGQPLQQCYHSVRAPAARIDRLAVVSSGPSA